MMYSTDYSQVLESELDMPSLHTTWTAVVLLVQLYCVYGLIFVHVFVAYCTVELMRFV